MSAPDRYAPCGICGHCPAYCPVGGTACAAWDPEQSTGQCACPGRTEKAAAPVAAYDPYDVATWPGEPAS